MLRLIFVHLKGVMGSVSDRDGSTDGRRKRLIAAILLGIAVLALLIFWWLTQRDDPASRLLQLLEDYRSELEYPGRTVPEAAETLGTIDAAFDFVTQDIALARYPDRRQSPLEVLATRLANPVDRAALFGALAEQMGWEMRYLALDRAEGAPIAWGKPPPEDSPALATLRDFLTTEVEMTPAMRARAKEAARMLAGKAALADVAATTDKAVVVLEHGENSPGLNFAYSNDYNTIDQSWWPTRFVVVAQRGDVRKVFDLIHPERNPTQEAALAGLMDTPLNRIRWDFSSEFFEMPEVVPVRLRLGLVDRTGLEQTLVEWQGNPAADELELRFLPAIAGPRKMRDGTQPDEVDRWQPYLRVNGRVLTGAPFSLALGGQTLTIGQHPPILAPDDIAAADPASATELEIVQIDATDWPLVRVGVRIKAGGGGTWLPNHFLLRDQGRARPLQLLSLRQTARPVLILTDVSRSMGETGAFEASKRAILSLVERIPDDQPVGLTGFAYAAVEIAKLAPLEDRQAFSKAVESLAMDAYTGILRALDTAAGNPDLAGGVVVLLSDGADNVGGDEAAITERLKQAGIKVFSIALGDEADAALLKRVAEATGGQTIYQGDAGRLETLFGRIGAEVSSLVQLQYRAEPLRAEGASPVAREADTKFAAPNDVSPAAETGAQVAGSGGAGQRQIVLSLRKSDLNAVAAYDPPHAASSPTAPYLYLELRTTVSGRETALTATRRPLLRLDRPDSALRLTGAWSPIGALGSYPRRTYLIAHLSRWIDTLRLLGVRTSAEIAAAPEPPPPQPMGAWLASGDRRWPGLARIRTVNAYRALSTLQTERGPVIPAPGPTMYLHHAEFARESGVNGPVTRRERFDVLLRPTRPLHASDWNRDTLSGEIAASVAEGRILGGQDAVTALLERASQLRFTPLSDLPENDTAAMPPGFVETITPGWEDSVLVGVPGRSKWLWQLYTESDNTRRNQFRTFHLAAGGFAKGAGLEQTAGQFERLNNMLDMYSAVYGNFAGLSPFAGAELAAFVALKQTENKLWCYSTLMMAQVGDAIEDDTALLNRSVDAAREKAASLCRIEGGAASAENGDLLRNGARNAAREWVRNYIINKAKEAAGSTVSNTWSAWDVGNALYDLVQGSQQAGPSGRSIGTAPQGPTITPAMDLAIANVAAGVD